MHGEMQRNGRAHGNAADDDGLTDTPFDDIGDIGRKGRDGKAADITGLGLTMPARLDGHPPETGIDRKGLARLTAIPAQPVLEDDDRPSPAASTCSRTPSAVTTCSPLIARPRPAHRAGRSRHQALRLKTGHA